MKKFLLRGIMAVVAVLTLGFSAQAQQGMQLPPLPADSAVRIGKLDNGLTYYIRHNETPKGQADFFIAQKVGSILENEEQRGLAHFLEHMCFNGTENFPGNSLIDWLETVGVKFGYNLNAYTGVDETVYNISSVPVDRTGVQDSCLLILHDWADGLLLLPEEIDAERGVIHQEWRRSMVGQMRILENLLPKIYPGSKYGERLPIGTMEVVDNFPPQAIRDYYETWYRPDQQGVIVIGDIDPDYIEAKIKEIFSPIKMPENAKERVYEPVPDTPGTIYALGSDKEQSTPVLLYMVKQNEDILPDELKNTELFFITRYLTGLVSNMLNQRLEELAQKPETPFAQASVEIDDYFLSTTKDAVSLQVVVKGNDTPGALQAAYAELLRAAKHGFTVSEYERAKADYLSSIERQYDQRAKRDNTSFAREYAANFTKGDPAPGIEFELEEARKLTGMLPLQAINAILPEFLSSQDNRVLLGMFPENDTFTIPTEQQLADAIAATEALELEAYQDDVKETPLVAQLPAPVKATSTTLDEATGVTTMTYPNGLTVKVKPTKFKDNEIVFNGMAKGGYSTAPDEDASSIIFLPYAMMNHGLGDYSNLDLQKYLQGKQVSLNLDFSAYDTELSGSTTPKDLPTLMELIYMNFTDFEITEEDFTSIQQRIAGMLANQESDPQYIFQKELLSSLYAAPAKQAISTDHIAKADRETTLGIIHRLLAHPSRFTLVFVGDIDMDTFVPLADQYLGTLRADRSTPVPYLTNPAYEFTTGDKVTEKTTAMQTPQTWTAITASANMPYTPKSKIETSMAAQILSNRLLKKIREEMGAVYSIGAGAQMSRTGDQNVFLQIPFPMDPAKRAEVLDEINKILQAMSTEVTAEELDPIKEYMIKNAKESLRKNEDWSGFLAAQTLNGVDTFTNTIETINSITPQDIAAFMKTLINAGNFRIFTLDPAE